MYNSLNLRDDIVSVGLTVNVRPYKYVIGKRWLDHSHTDQRSILEKLESSFRELYTGLNGSSYVTFEVCPMLGNVHMHAFMTLPRSAVKHIRPYYHKHLGDKDKSSWRLIDIKYLNNIGQWLQYITKDLEEDEERTIMKN